MNDLHYDIFCKNGSQDYSEEHFEISVSQPTTVRMRLRGEIVTPDLKISPKRLALAIINDSGATTLGCIQELLMMLYN